MFFPITKKKIYFDSARSGGLSSELSNWRKNHEKLFLKEGSLFRNDNNKLIEEVRKGVSKFIGSVNNYTFLTPSFSLGFQSLLSFLDPKLNFLVLKEDYPSIINGLKLNNFNYLVLENSFDIEQKMSVAFPLSDKIIYGHTHMPFVGTLFSNTGTFVEIATYITEQDGVFILHNMDE